MLADDLAGETGVQVPAVYYQIIGGPMSYGTDNTANVVNALDWRSYEWLVLRVQANSG